MQSWVCPYFTPSVTLFGILCAQGRSQAGPAPPCTCLCHPYVHTHTHTRSHLTFDSNCSQLLMISKHVQLVQDFVSWNASPLVLSSLLQGHLLGDHFYEVSPAPILTPVWARQPPVCPECLCSPLCMPCCDSRYSLSCQTMSIVKVGFVSLHAQQCMGHALTIQCRPGK